MVRKGEYILSQTQHCSVTDRFPGKEHTARSHQPALPPQRGTNLALFPVIQFPTFFFSCNTCFLFPLATSSGSSTVTCNLGTPQAHLSWLFSVMPAVGVCHATHFCYPKHIQQISKANLQQCLLKVTLIMMKTDQEPTAQDAEHHHCFLSLGGM